jgi:hypothetical protein
MALPAVLLAAGWSLQALVDQPLLKVVIWVVLLNALAYLTWRRLLITGDRRMIAAYGRRVTALVETQLTRNKRSGGESPRA